MFEEIYHEYLLHKNEENRKERYAEKEGWYHASGAGLCSRKLYYESVEKIKPTNPPDKKSMRIMGLGTVMHNDIQNALIYYNNIYNNINISNVKEKKEISSYKKKKLEFQVEGEITIPSLNVRGFYDVVSFDYGTSESSDTDPFVRLYDIKTIGAFAWKKRFNEVLPLQGGHHYLQLGTYGLALREKYKNRDSMSLIYYNKDTSIMREAVVPLGYVDQAKRYWYTINEEHSKGLPRFKPGTSPVHKWVCNYCQFKDHCNPPNI